MALAGGTAKYERKDRIIYILCLRKGGWGECLGGLTSDGVGGFQWFIFPAGCTDDGSFRYFPVVSGGKKSTGVKTGGFTAMNSMNAKDLINREADGVCTRLRPFGRGGRGCRVHLMQSRQGAEAQRQAVLGIHCGFLAAAGAGPGQAKLTDGYAGGNV
jgi:hypothetical protein